MGFQVLDIDELQRGQVCSRQYHFRGGPSFQGLLPSGGAEAPFVPGHETGETELRNGGGKIVPHLCRKLQELLRSDDTDGVDAVIPCPGPAVAIPEKPGHGFETTWDQFFPFDILGHAHILRHHETPDKHRIDYS